MSPNIDKTKYLFFTKNCQVNKWLKNKTNRFIKYLDVHWDDKLRWNKLVEHLVTKLLGATGAFYKLPKYLPLNVLMSVYNR